MGAPVRAGASTQTSRLTNTFLDVLRMFTHYSPGGLPISLPISPEFARETPANQATGDTRVRIPSMALQLQTNQRFGGELVMFLFCMGRWHRLDARRP